MSFGLAYMPSSIFSKNYTVFREMLSSYRKEANLTQQNLAEKLNKPQSFVSKYESGERRLDLIEFLEVAEALQFDVFEFIRKLQKDTTKK